MKYLTLASIALQLIIIVILIDVKTEPEFQKREILVQVQQNEDVHLWQATLESENLAVVRFTK